MQTTTQWQPGTGTTLYVHVPFCVVKCGYCDFNSFADASTTSHDRFLDALERELQIVELGAAPPTVFIGGGTPSYLDATRFERMLRILDATVTLGDCTEVTIESNPESLTLEKARIAAAFGIRRFSVGAQTFDAEHLKFLDRAHDAAGTEAAVAALREAGADNVSLDLMFGLPGQSIDAWRNDLERALALRPDHLSCYNLTLEAGTRLRRDYERGLVRPNDPDHDLAMFDLTRELLERHGFVPYEISNFAGRGGPCLHNDHYWLQGNYVGVGPGAASHQDGHRTTNLKALNAWAAAIDRGELPIGDREQLAPLQRAGEAVWLGLRRRDGVDPARIAANTGVDVLSRFGPAIERFVASGHMTASPSALQLTDSGMRVSDSIAEEFLLAD